MFERIKQRFRWPTVYTLPEQQAVEAHIARYFGKSEMILHEKYSPDIHVDVIPIAPDGERDYYTLVTCGMGAFKMKMPEGGEELARAELVIALPPDWKVYEKSEEWFWPCQMLKILARLPIESGSWLGWGHTIEFGEGMCGDAGFEGAMLLLAMVGQEGSEECRLPSGETVYFYQVMPIYADEMAYKERYGAMALMSLFEEKMLMPTVDIHRLSVLDEKAEPRWVCMDDGREHAQKIIDKKLPLEELAGYQHLAIFLRWLIQRDLLCGEFRAQHGAMMEAVKAGRYDGDLRAFVRDELGGALTTGILSEEGAVFVRWYYGYCVREEHYYPCDVDRYALEYFGEERFNSPEYQDEAYLFIPWDEGYYRAMADKIEGRYQAWKRREE